MHPLYLATTMAWWTWEGMSFLKYDAEGIAFLFMVNLVGKSLGS